jgi:hypothetical protein
MMEEFSIRSLSSFLLRLYNCQKKSPNQESRSKGRMNTKSKTSSAKYWITDLSMIENWNEGLKD